MDESNHGEVKSRIGEIIVATCSYNKTLWEYKKHFRRRDFSKVNERLNENLIDYVYTLLPHEIAKYKYSNLPLVAPFLVDSLLEDKAVSKVKLGLDGQLKREDKNNLIDTLEETGLEFDVFNFIKRNHVHYGPELIYLSHLIANNLFSQSMLEIAKDDHYLAFDILKI